MDTEFDLEQLLEDGNRIRVKPQGYSMYRLGGMRWSSNGKIPPGFAGGTLYCSGGRAVSWSFTESAAGVEMIFSWWETTRSRSRDPSEENRSRERLRR